MNSICDNFHQNPYVNPKTGRSITSHGLTFKSLVKECVDPCDKMGYEIFKIFDDKYRLSDKIFDTDRKNVNNLAINGLVTQNGYKNLINVIDMYERAYMDFILNVDENRTFIEKSSSTSKPRPILTSKDWAEALIELTNLVSIYRRDLKTFIDISTNRENIKAECNKLQIDDCSSPCIKRNTFYRKAYCDF